MSYPSPENNQNKEVTINNAYATVEVEGGERGSVTQGSAAAAAGNDSINIAVPIQLQDFDIDIFAKQHHFMG
jgi:hypothetical protein